MRQITEISNEYQQIHLIPIEGSAIRAYLTLEFKPLNNAWYFSLSWGDTFSTKNEQIVTSQNLLRQYKNIIPFGMGVMTKSLVVDPMTKEAFSTGDASLYFLSAAEVEAQETEFYA